MNLASLLRLTYLKKSKKSDHSPSGAIFNCCQVILRELKYGKIRIIIYPTREVKENKLQSWICSSFMAWFSSAREVFVSVNVVSSKRRFASRFLTGSHCRRLGDRLCKSSIIFEGRCLRIIFVYVPSRVVIAPCEPQTV